MGGIGVTPAASYALTAEEISAFQYLRKAGGGVPVLLNLAEERQYNHVINMLRRAGRTPQKHPQLFRAVEEARRRGPAGPPRVANSAEDVAMVRATQLVDAGPVAADDPLDLTLTGINYITDFGENPQTGAFSTSGFSTYPPPSTTYPTTTEVLVSLIDADDNVVLNSGHQQVFNQTNVTVPVTATPPTGHHNVSSNALFGVQPVGAPMAFYSQIVDNSTAAISSACQQSPGYKPAGQPQQCESSVATSCVNTGSISNQLKICYGPRVNTDCDYGCTGAGVPPNIIFPIKGSVDLGVVPPSRSS